MKKNFIYVLSFIGIISSSFVEAKVMCPKSIDLTTAKNIIDQKEGLVDAKKITSIDSNGLSLRYADTEVKLYNLLNREDLKVIPGDKIIFKDDEIINRGYLLCTYEIRNSKGALKTTVKFSARGQ